LINPTRRPQATTSLDPERNVFLERLHKIEMSDLKTLASVDIHSMTDDQLVLYEKKIEECSLMLDNDEALLKQRRNVVDLVREELQVMKEKRKAEDQAAEKIKELEEKKRKLMESRSSAAYGT